jgi:hypothetical protein
MELEVQALTGAGYDDRAPDSLLAGCGARILV